MNQKRTVKDMPESERPYEKCLASGPEVLSDAELLAVLLRTGTREQTSIDLARELLTLNKNLEGLPGLLHLDSSELMNVRGIGPVKAVQILCICELTKRMSRLSARKKLTLASPESIADYFMEQLRHLEREHVIALFFDGKHRLLKEDTISVGTVNAAPVSPREIFLEALKVRAVYVVLLHNHPSGDPSPSRQDIQLTTRMIEAGRLIGISLSDHIIIGDRRYYSFREENTLCFET